jgi:transposase-like protein
MDIQNQFISRRIYSLEFRYRVCKDHIEDGIVLADLVRKYDLSCHSLIHDWLRKLGYLPGRNRRTHAAYIDLQTPTALTKKTNKDKELSEEQKQMKLLQKELEDARLLAEGYRRIIEIAEQELKIPIRKKPNTK